MADKGENSHVILEFFSGIGGMRYAAEAWADLSGTCASLRSVRVAASFEISEVCNRIYDHNFGDKPKTKSIEHLDAAYLDSFGADTWLMSPPCQPYTSMGKQRDAGDPRARALLHLCDVIPKLSTPPSYILLENVNHFQHSQSHGLWLDAMKAAGYLCHEFLLSPAQIGIPNERLRYYCLAKRQVGSTSSGIFDTSIHH
jgi:tRNA (cytosine38-C5)-methyltransferase